jgi:hypothetical protein
MAYLANGLPISYGHVVAIKNSNTSRVQLDRSGVSDFPVYRLDEGYGQINGDL